ncbi:FixH family protein [Oceanibium sediminis]|uniref:FixH family protein n=1 Tax=Oceanibium sediminis TaxID=2026339 RepID=UPI000DD34BE9|nr:FixH family protein [Oceanibium sediminis]
MTDHSETTARPLTGRKVLAITVGAFGVILAANLTLLFSALGSFPGLETANSYVASQAFDTDRKAQIALGWDVSASVEGDRVLLRVTDRDGLLLTPARISAKVGRATHVQDDQVLAFVARPDGKLVAPARLEAGLWTLWLDAEAADGTAFRQRLNLTVGARG